MRTEEVAVPEGVDLEGAVGTVERCFGELGLRVAMKGTLAAHKGCVHWHLKRGKERGTLEVTLWPARRRAWLSVHANRGAAWIEETLGQLKHAVQATLARGVDAAARRVRARAAIGMVRGSGAPISEEHDQFLADAYANRSGGAPR